MISTIAAVALVAVVNSGPVDLPGVPAPVPVIDESPVLAGFLAATADPASLSIVDTDLGALTCPVAGDHDFVSSWGFARSGGRRHQGNDLMASRGTPVVAIRSGTVTGVDRLDGAGDLGGRTVWLTDGDGTRFYYAHLDSIESELEVGDSVSVGDSLGTVGATGNASPGAPHLHFEIRPPGGVIDPFPVLAQICDGAKL